MRPYDAILATSSDRPPFPNGSSHERWVPSWCERCGHDRSLYIDGGCPIAFVACEGRTPTEWVRDGDGYTCTEFVEDRGWDTPVPEPEPDPAQGSLDGLIDLYAADLKLEVAV
ncbi:hypothetical protein AB0I28_12365 [Phytomonospora sp. NPDC050363]|uniref:hypothetical protein n=1 Tax=Phytomonospora sp. NPDC050363 TaxID=3155642 RepID=UPI0033D618E8